MAGIILNERNRGAAKVYSEKAGTQAEESNGDALNKRLPWCTVVSGQIDLKIGGACIASVPR
ncbi:MAG: hypothetical protein M1282_01435 [Chloroflexi bacterium]|nr:hypothetical protein [Chloroflexota bacterium]